MRDRVRHGAARHGLAETEDLLEDSRILEDGGRVVELGPVGDDGDGASLGDRSRELREGSRILLRDAVRREHHHERQSLGAGRRRVDVEERFAPSRDVRRCGGEPHVMGHRHGRRGGGGRDGSRRCRHGGPTRWGPVSRASTTAGSMRRRTATAARCSTMSTPRRRAPPWIAARSNGITVANQPGRISMPSEAICHAAGTPGRVRVVHDQRPPGPSLHRDTRPDPSCPIACRSPAAGPDASRSRCGTSDRTVGAGAAAGRTGEPPVGEVVPDKVLLHSHDVGPVPCGGDAISAGGVDRASTCRRR